MANDFISNYRGAKSQENAKKALSNMPISRNNNRTEKKPVLKDMAKIDASSSNDQISSVTDYNRQVGEWNHDQISQLLRNRSAYAPEESPYLSLDVDIPVTTNTRKIQSGKLKLLNDINNTALSKDMALYIVGNTYQDNDDGTHYGLNWDGRPYSYKIEGNEVKDFEPLGAEEQKKVISHLTDGKVTVDESIENPGTLAQIYRSIKRMQDYGNGNLIPGRVKISDITPDTGTYWGALAYAQRNGDWDNEKRKYSDIINYYNADFPEINAFLSSTSGRDANSNDVEWWTTSHPDNVTSHELAHTADYNDADRRIKERIEELWGEYSKLHKVYTTEQLFDNLISNITANLKYRDHGKRAASRLDNFFGGKTHFYEGLGGTVSDFQNTEADEDYLANRIAGFVINDSSVSKPFQDASNSEMGKEIKNKISALSDALKENEGLRERLLQKAAENAGFENWEEGAESIGEYATHSDLEAVAEAYNDVLFNKDKAKPFSKELIKVLSDEVDKWMKIFEKRDSSEFQKKLRENPGIMSKKELQDPVVYYERLKKQNNPFSR